MIPAFDVPGTEPPLRRVLGPCPGCDDWQLDYTVADLLTYARGAWAVVEADETFATTMRKTIDAQTAAAVRVVEEVVHDHARDCIALRAWAAALGHDIEEALR